MRIIGFINVWNNARFIRSAIESLRCLDDIWIVVGTAPYFGAIPPLDETLDHVRASGCKYITGAWRASVVNESGTAEAAQRNALLDAIILHERSSGRDPLDGETFICICDADEAYEPAELKRALPAIRAYDMVKVPQHIYFKHCNWRVTPAFVHPPLDIFVRLTNSFRFTYSRGGSIGPRIWQMEPSQLVVHHFNTVGTYEEVKAKHAHHTHADVLPADWTDRVWVPATLESKNLHQLFPEMLPGLERVPMELLPAHMRHNDELLPG